MARLRPHNLMEGHRHEQNHGEALEQVADDRTPPCCLEIVVVSRDGCAEVASDHAQIVVEIADPRRGEPSIPHVLLLVLSPRWCSASRSVRGRQL